MHPSLIAVSGQCPWCGERLDLFVEPEILQQEYVEDCRICCAPILVLVSFEPGDFSAPYLQLRRENE